MPTLKGSILALLGLASLAGCQTTQTAAIPVAPASLGAAGKPALFVFQTDAMPAIHLGDGSGRIADVMQHPRARAQAATKSVRWSFELSDLPTAGTLRITIFSLQADEPACVTALTLNGIDLANLAKFSPAGAGISTNAEIFVPPAKLHVGRNYLEIAERECPGGGWNDSLVEAASLTLE